MKAARLLGILLLVSTGCTYDPADENRSPVLLRISQVTATAGGGGTGGSILLSDVQDTEGSVFNDNVSLQILNVAKNPRNTANLNELTDIIVERFEVRYVRSDGRDVEGVDVPFAISGAVTSLIPVGGTQTVSLIVVRHQAKREPPLANMAAQGALLSGGAKILQMFANITLYGRTVAGQAVKSNEAHLEIAFGDFNGS